MSTATSRVGAKLREQIDAAPWLRWALLAIGILFVLYVLQEVERVRLQTQDESIAAEARARQIRALEGQDAWFGREKEAQRTHETLLAEIPVAATPGIAQAALQSWLGDITKSISDSSSVRITVEGAAPVESIPGMLRIRATLRGGMTPREALNLLRQIEGSRNLVIVETIDIRSDANRLATITLNAFYRIGNAPDASPAETP